MITCHMRRPHLHGEEKEFPNRHLETTADYTGGAKPPFAVYSEFDLLALAAADPTRKNTPSGKPRPANRRMPIRPGLEFAAET